MKYKVVQPIWKTVWRLLKKLKIELPCDPMDCSPPGSSVLSSENFPDKKTGVCCHVLLQGIFPTEGLNLGLLHCRQILYHLSRQGSSGILGRVA